MSTKNERMSERAMLVHLRVSSWTGEKTDSEVSEEVCESHNASTDAGTWRTQFLPKKDRDELTNAAARLRGEFKRDTLPWFDEGKVRVIASKKIFDWTGKMRKAIADYHSFIDTWLKDRYPEILQTMPDRLKSLAKQNMPTASELKSRLTAHINMYPMPDIQDFRCDIGDAEAAEIRKEVENSINERTKCMTTALWNKMNSLVAKVENTLSDVDKKIQDRLYDNLVQFCVDLPDMNLTGDEKLEQMRQEIIEKLRLCTVEPEVLRKDKKERKDTAKAAKDLLKTLASYTS